MRTPRIHFVTGATGFIGRDLVRKLSVGGEIVVALVRSETLAANPNLFADVPGNLRVVPGDITEPNLGLALDTDLPVGEWVVWHLAASLTFASDKRAQVTDANVTGTENVVAFANERSARLVHMSTAYVCGDHTGTFTEADLDVGQGFRNHYERTKFQAERIVREERIGPTIIMRPSIVIGDAYEGKAEGCTFGYYRWAFMIFLFRAWLRKTMSKQGFGAACLRLLGTRIDEETGEIHVPWVVVPFPKTASVDLVPIDHVVDSMIVLAGNEQAWELGTFHLTHPRPAASFTVLTAAIRDFGLVGCRYWRLSSGMFRFVLRTMYYLSFPLRNYTKSVYWYLPYVAQQHQFDRKNCLQVGVSDPEPMTAERLTTINAYAEREIFAKVDQSSLKRYLCI